MVRRLRVLLKGPASSFQAKADAPLIREIAVSSSSSAEAQHAKQNGNTALAIGDIAGAVTSYRRAVALSPTDPLAHLNLGFGLLEQGDLSAAEDSLRHALLLDETSHEACYLIARIHSERGNWIEAKSALETAVTLAPGFEYAWRDLGAAHEHLGDTSAALASYEHAIAVQPEFLDAIHAHALLLLKLERYGDALNWAERLRRMEPASAVFAVLAGNALQGLSRYDQALEAADAALSSQGDDSAAWYLRGNSLFMLRRYEEAIAAYRTTLEVIPDLVEALSNCGAASQRLGQHQDAMHFLHRALALRPDYTPAAYNLGATLLDMWRCREAIEVTHRALVHEPESGDLHWNLAIAHLLLGELEQGFAEYEWRWKAKTLRHQVPTLILTQPRWSGREPIEGQTVLLFAEQGLGDSIQFLRYVPLLAQRAGRVLLRIPSILEPLAVRLCVGCRIVKEDELLPPYDYQCALMSLPHVFGTTLSSIPANVPYLYSDAERTRRWELLLGPRQRLRVGLVWSGNPGHENDRNRSIRLSELMPLKTLNVQFVSLQKELRDDDREVAAKWPELLHFGNHFETFADTAALAQAMDLVVCVDTSVAHLAGALARPLWLLLPYRSDWRWLGQRTDSPWYPTARLFRQDESRQWAPVLQKMMSALQEMTMSVSATDAELQGGYYA